MSRTLKEMAAAGYMALGLAVAGQVFAATQPATLTLSGTAAITVESHGREFDGSVGTFGFSFSVLQDLVVTSLGAYDSGKDGLASSTKVGIWTAAGGQPLISAIVPEGRVGDLEGYFRYVNIPRFSLLAGNTYVIGAFSTDRVSSMFTETGGSGNTDSRKITLIKDAYSYDGSFSYPYMSDGMNGPWLAANLRTTIAPIPEPETYQMLALGMLVVTAGATLRRRRQDAGN